MPGVICAIFAAGVEHRILWGQLAWLVFLIISLAYNIVVRYLPKKAWGYVKEKSAVEDDHV